MITVLPAGAQRGGDVDLQVPKDEEFQRREWRWERAGWAAMAAVLLAGLAGLLGSGPASWARAAGSAGLVEVEYQRITHHEADDSLTLTLAPRAARTGTVTVELTGSWVSGVDLQGITPQPSEQLAVPGGVALQVPVAEPGETQVFVSYRPQGYGTLTAEVAVAEDRVTFSQIVLP